MTLTTVFDPYRAAQAIADLDLIKAANPGCYTLAGVPYVATMTPAGIVLQKAARKSNLQTGATKEKNGVTYVFNENRRWTRQDKKGRSRAKNKPPEKGSTVNDGAVLRPKKTQKKGKQWAPKQSASRPVAEGTVGTRKERAVYQAMDTAAKNYTPSLESLFAQADAVGSKYQDSSDPASLSARRAANAIVDDATDGLTNEARGVADLNARRKAKDSAKFDVVSDRASQPAGTLFYDDPGVTPEQKKWMERGGQNYIPPTIVSRSEIDEIFPNVAATAEKARGYGYQGKDDYEVVARYMNGGAARQVSDNNVYPIHFTDAEPAGASDRADKSESGGGIVPAGGKLSAAPKTPEAANAEGQEAINQRYASANPSQADVSGWLQDSIQEYLSPASDKALHAEVLKELKIHHGVYEGHVTGDLADAYKKIRDRQSFAEGAADSNEHYVNVVRKGKLMTPEDVGLWMNEPELKSAERRMKSGKTEGSRAKAKQEFEKLSAKKAERLAESAEIAEKMNSKYTAPREEQIQRYLKIYDDKFAAAKAEKEQLHQQFLKGNKKAVQTVTERVLKPLDTFSPTDMFEGSKKVKDPDRVYREAVRSHLIQTHQQGGGDAATLGLQGRPNSPEELKAAYRRAAATHHPDRGGSRDAFEQVRGAYERLADEHYPDMRKSLDPYFTWGRDYYVATMTPSGVVLKKATTQPF